MGNDYKLSCNYDVKLLFNSEHRVLKRELEEILHKITYGNSNGRIKIQGKKYFANIVNCNNINC